jgi:hypothetical protein
MLWMVLIVRLTGTPSRDRVAVWRELRRVGAAPLSQGVWTVPETPFFAEAVQKAAGLAARGNGELLVLSANADDPATQQTLESAFRDLRLEEWAEFERDCGKFEEEIAKEIRIGKFTLGELEEEDQSLDRLRRWYRDLKSRDVLELPEARRAEERLQQCTGRLDGYAEMVYARLHAADEPAAATKAADGQNAAAS